MPVLGAIRILPISQTKIIIQNKFDICLSFLLIHSHCHDKIRDHPRFNRAIAEGVLLPQINLLPSLPGITQRFFSLHQSPQEFIQRLCGFIRRLNEFIQSSKDANQPLRGFHQPLPGFIQRFFGFHQSLREANQSLSDADQPSFTTFLPKRHIGPQISRIGADFCFSAKICAICGLNP